MRGVVIAKICKVYEEWNNREFVDSFNCGFEVSVMFQPVHEIAYVCSHEREETDVGKPDSVFIVVHYGRCYEH